MGKGENAGYHRIFFFPYNVSKLLFSRDCHQCAVKDEFIICKCFQFRHVSNFVVCLESTEFMVFNSLPNDKIVALTNLKAFAFADNKSNVPKIVISVFDRTENIVGK